MSGWESTGGAGGITARYEDMEALARLYRQAAGTVGWTVADVAGIAASGALLESAMLSPGSFAEVMAMLGGLELGPSGLASSGLELEALSLLLMTAVSAYRGADELLSTLQTDAENLGGFAVGAALPMVALPAAFGVGTVESARELPAFLDDLVHGQAGLFSFPSRVLTATKADASRTRSAVTVCTCSRSGRTTRRARPALRSPGHGCSTPQHRPSPSSALLP